MKFLSSYIHKLNIAIKSAKDHLAYYDLDTPCSLHKDQIINAEILRIRKMERKKDFFQVIYEKILS